VRNKTEKGYHKLILWTKLKELLKLGYELIDKLPDSENYGLKPQMKRALISVMSNFVEGYLKTSKKDKARFMEISNTSLQELEAQSEACLILGFWTEQDYELFDSKRGEVGYFMYRYKLSLKSP